MLMSPSLWASHQRQPPRQPSLVKVDAGSSVFKGFGSGHQPERLQGSHASTIVQDGGSRRSKVVRRGHGGAPYSASARRRCLFLIPKKGWYLLDAALDCGEPTVITQSRLPSLQLFSGKAKIQISLLMKISCLFLFRQQAQIILKCCMNPSTVHCRDVT